MFARNVGQILISVVVLTAFCASASAEKTVYKWVDAEGHVHFGDAPPPGADPADAETLVIPKSPAYGAPAQPAVTPAVAAAPVEEKQIKQPKEASMSYVQTDITDLSLEDLNLRCDEARETMIAPLREAEIEKCKQDKREDPAFCERFNADFGEGGRTASGSIRPRMFDDLPECKEALEEKHRRGR